MLSVLKCDNCGNTVGYLSSDVQPAATKALCLWCGDTRLQYPDEALTEAPISARRGSSAVDVDQTRTEGQG